MPALQTYIIELCSLLPERDVDHPLGCHRSRVPDRVVFEKLLQVLVFGCAYWRISDEGCSATTLRRRRDEWMDLGAMDALERIAREAYDRVVGLELGEQGNDRLRGGYGDDTLTGGPGTDNFSGGSGNDTIFAADGELDSISCGLGVDVALVDEADVDAEGTNIQNFIRLTSCETINEPATEEPPVETASAQ